MIKLFNALSLNSRLFLRRIGRGYRFYNQKLDFDKILTKNYAENKPFTFVQIGANDGVSFDNLYEIVTTRKSEGILIEPLQEYFDQLLDNYKNFPNILKIKKAVHPTKRNISIYKVTDKALHKYPDWARGIASLDPEHHLKININSEDIISKNVECLTLMEIIRDSRIVNFNYIQIDTEGFDFEVLKMIDFSAIKPTLIKYESINLLELDRLGAKELLIKNGYYHYDSGFDSFAINLNKMKLYWK